LIAFPHCCICITNSRFAFLPFRFSIPVWN
jgi:hypothetical protein